jgi:hypothetical protein
MRGKALLAFLITAALTVVAFAMHQKNPDQVSMTPALMLGAVALLSLVVVGFAKPSVNASQRERDRRGLHNICAACGHAERWSDPLTLTDDGYRICTSHVLDPDSGFYGRGRR